MRNIIIYNGIIHPPSSLQSSTIKQQRSFDKNGCASATPFKQT
nr:MAG TPA: hypothetical protein [Caudoviricetes sp.]